MNQISKSYIIKSIQQSSRNISDNEIENTVKELLDL